MVGLWPSSSWAVTEVFWLSGYCCHDLVRGIRKAGILEPSWSFNLRNGSLLLMKSKKQHQDESPPLLAGFHFSHGVSSSKCPLSVPSGRAVRTHSYLCPSQQSICVGSSSSPISYLSSRWHQLWFCPGQTLLSRSHLLPPPDAPHPALPVADPSLPCSSAHTTKGCSSSRTWEMPREQHR